jgi:hypothetical protein
MQVAGITMKVAEITLDTLANQERFYNEILERQDKKEEIYTIANPSTIGASEFSRTGTRLELRKIEVDVSNESHVYGKVKDLIKKGFDVDASYEIEVYLTIECLEEGDI